MNDLTTIEMQCDETHLRISVKLTPEGIAAALDALCSARDVLCDMFRRRGWVPPPEVKDVPPPAEPAAPAQPISRRKAVRS